MYNFAFITSLYREAKSYNNKATGKQGSHAKENRIVGFPFPISQKVFLWLLKQNININIKYCHLELKKGNIALFVIKERWFNMVSKISFSIPELKTINTITTLQISACYSEMKAGFNVEEEHLRRLSSIKGKIERALKDYVENNKY